MRDILFRAKSGQTWYYGGVHREKLYHGPIGCDDYKYRWHIVTDEGDEYRVRPDTICQYTSVTDKNGTKIFEGDIVRIGRYFSNFYTVDDYVCKYDTNTASFKFYYIVPKDIADVNKYAILGDGSALSDMGRGFTIEVIGNIYDNSKQITDVEKSKNEE